MFARANLLGLRRLFEMRTLEAAITALDIKPGLKKLSLLTIAAKKSSVSAMKATGAKELEAAAQKLSEGFFHSSEGIAALAEKMVDASEL